MACSKISTKDNVMLERRKIVIPRYYERERIEGVEDDSEDWVTTSPESMQAHKPEYTEKRSVLRSD